MGVQVRGQGGCPQERAAPQGELGQPAKQLPCLPACLPACLSPYPPPHRARPFGPQPQRPATPLAQCSAKGPPSSLLPIPPSPAQSPPSSPPALGARPPARPAPPPPGARRPRPTAPARCGCQCRRPPPPSPAPAPQPAEMTRPLMPSAWPAAPPASSLQLPGSPWPAWPRLRAGWTPWSPPVRRARPPAGQSARPRRSVPLPAGCAAWLPLRCSCCLRPAGKKVETGALTLAAGVLPPPGDPPADTPKRPHLVGLLAAAEWSCHSQQRCQEEHPRRHRDQVALVRFSRWGQTSVAVTLRFKAPSMPCAARQWPPPSYEYSGGGSTAINNQR